MVKKFVVSIEVENDAFSDESCALELSRILREVANRLEYEDRGYYDEGRVLYDENGNTVGTARFIEEKSNE